MMDLVAVLLFQLLVPFLPGLEVKFKPMGLIVLAFFPIALGSFAIIRLPRTSKYITKQEEAEVEVVSRCERTVVHYSLVADYGKRPFFESRFETAVAEYNN